MEIIKTIKNYKSGNIYEISIFYNEKEKEYLTQIKSINKIEEERITFSNKEELKEILSGVEAMMSFYKDLPLDIKKDEGIIELSNKNAIYRKNEVSTENKIKTFNKYEVTFKSIKSKPLSMRKTVHYVISEYVKNNNISSIEVKKLFNTYGLPSTSYDVVKTVDEYVAWSMEKSNSVNRYFIRPEELIKTTSEKVCVCNQWTTTSFNRFIKKVESLNLGFYFKKI